MKTQRDWLNLISSIKNPTDPVHQLVLNALESGTHRIDISTSYIEQFYILNVCDYGDGMSESDIETYLLTFPGSSKPAPHEGTGFAKVFSIPFENIVITTRKYGQFSETILNNDGSYTTEKKDSGHDGTKITIVTDKKKAFFNDDTLYRFIESYFSSSDVDIYFNNKKIVSSFNDDYLVFKETYYRKFRSITISVTGEEKCHANFFRNSVFIAHTDSHLPFLEIQVNSEIYEKCDIIESIKEVFSIIHSELIDSFIRSFIKKLQIIARQNPSVVLYREYFWYFVNFIKSGYLKSVSDLTVLPSIDSPNRKVSDCFTGSLDFSRYKQNAFNLNKLTPVMVMDLRKAIGITDEIDITIDKDSDFSVIPSDKRDDFLVVFRRIFRSETGKDCEVVYSHFSGTSEKYTCLFETDRAGFVYELKRGVRIKKVHLNYYSETITQLKRLSDHLPEFSQKILKDFISCYR